LKARVHPASETFLYVIHLRPRTESNIRHDKCTISISLQRIIMQFITCCYLEQNWLFKTTYLLNQNSGVVF